jgi:hypothetical protein
MRRVDGQPAIDVEEDAEERIARIVTATLAHHAPKITYTNGNGNPRWRVIAELLIVGAVAWIAAREYEHGQFEQKVNDQLQSIGSRLDAVVRAVKPIMRGDPDGEP